MTSKNLNWKNRKTVYKPRPFLLQPACKEALWGGQKLKEHFGKKADLDNIAESWECSTHPEGPSTITTGEHKGMLLTEVLQRYPEYLGTHPRSKGELPILVKFIDARQKLSVQVHPDDEYAKLYERGQLGKTEMWYVLEADKDAELIYGFYSDMDSVAVRQSLANGTIEKYLQKVKVQQDDVFYIPAGTVHGIGAGNLIVEVQESSNLTPTGYMIMTVSIKLGKSVSCIWKKLWLLLTLRAKQHQGSPCVCCAIHQAVRRNFYAAANIFRWNGCC